MVSAMQMLIVEDEPQTLELLQAYFEVQGHDVATATDGVAALERFDELENVDLMLLDVGLPQLDGWSVLEALRARSDVPIILFTAADSIDDVVRGFSLGADDYMRKPVQVRELHVRIQAILRRYGRHSGSCIHRYGGLVLDDEKKVVTLDDSEVTLTPKEFALLRLLIRAPGRVFSNDEIMAALWPVSERADISDVKQYIYLLRNKLETSPSSARLIKNIKGFGYTLGTRGGE